MSDTNKLDMVDDTELEDIAGGSIVVEKDGSFEYHVYCPICGKAQVVIAGAREKHVEISRALSCECGHSWSVDFKIR